MGLSPREVDRLSLWEFIACKAGYELANGGEPPIEAPSNEEHDALTAKYADV